VEIVNLFPVDIRIWIAIVVMIDYLRCFFELWVSVSAIAIAIAITIAIFRRKD
jgi:hypothetical protein